VHPEVAKRKGAEQCVGHGVSDQVTVACRLHTSSGVDHNSSQPDRAGTTKSMGIKAPTNPDS
jgi:hypothetical protein